MTVVYDLVFSYRSRAVGRHLYEAEYALKPSSGACVAVAYVCSTVLVPKWAGVYYSLRFVYEYRRVPLSGRVGSLHHEYAVVRIAPIDVELAVMVAYGGCPHSVSMPWAVECVVYEYSSVRHCCRGGCLSAFVGLGGYYAVKCVAYDGPVYQIAGVQDREARHAIERRGGHIVVVTNSTQVGVGIVRIQDRVLVISIPKVGHPYFAYVAIVGCRRVLRHCARRRARQ